MTRCVGLLAIFCLAAPCSAQSDFYTKYQPINDPRAEKFIEDGLKYAVELFGNPALPVNKVHLRLSQPLDPTSNLRKGFQLTELADANKGIFCIYLGAKPEDYSYHGQLAHEIGHLLNARLYDCYAEGLCTLLAEKYLAKVGKDWTGWAKYFLDGHEPFYGTTYHLMKDVDATAGTEAMKTLLTAARYSDDTQKRMYIDIDVWLASLPAEKRQKVRDVILKHADKVKKANIGTSASSFRVPK